MIKRFFAMSFVMPALSLLVLIAVAAHQWNVAAAFGFAIALVFAVLYRLEEIKAESLAELANHNIFELRDLKDRITDRLPPYLSDIVLNERKKGR